MGAGLSPNKAPFPVNTDMVLVSKVRDGNVDKACVLFPFCGLSRPGIADHRSCVGVFLCGPGRITRAR